MAWRMQTKSGSNLRVFQNFEQSRLIGLQLVASMLAQHRDLMFAFIRSVPVTRCKFASLLKSSAQVFGSRDIDRDRNLLT